MPLDHYVQRALLKSWSRRLPGPGRWDNEVWVFEFATGKLTKRSTRQTFARDGLNKKGVEARLGKLIESPLARLALSDSEHRASGQQATKRSIDDWRTLRALSLVFLVQGARSMDGTSEESGALAKIISAPDEALDALAVDFLGGHSIATVAVPQGPLFMPESGWYVFPVFDARRGPVWAVALPLNPQTVLFAVPKGVVLDGEALVAQLIGNFSVGVGDGSAQVVVARALVDAHGVDALRETLPRLREEVERLRDHIENVRALTARIHVQAGLSPPVTSALSWSPANRKAAESGYMEDLVDIHHIFPADYCEKAKLDQKYWNSVVNKGPLTAKTNRSVGGY